MNAPREPKPLAGAVYHPGAGFHSYPPPKDRTPQPRECGHCHLVAATNAATCPVCGERYRRRLRSRLMARLGRA